MADGAGADQQLCRDLPIRQPTGGKPGDTQLLGGQAGRVFVAARIAGQVELALRPGMQKSRTDPVERARGGAEVLGGVRSPPRPSQPFSVKQPGAGMLERVVTRARLESYLEVALSIGPGKGPEPVRGRAGPRRTRAADPGIDPRDPRLDHVEPAELRRRLRQVRRGQQSRGRMRGLMARLVERRQQVQGFLRPAAEQRRPAAYPVRRGAQGADPARHRSEKRLLGVFRDHGVVATAGGQPRQRESALGGDVVGAHLLGQPQCLVRCLRGGVPSAGEKVEDRGLRQHHRQRGKILPAPQRGDLQTQHVSQRALGPPGPHQQCRRQKRPGNDAEQTDRVAAPARGRARQLSRFVVTRPPGRQRRHDR